MVQRKEKKRKRHLLKNAVVRKKLENEEDICKKIQWSTEKVENEDDICKKKIQCSSKKLENDDDIFEKYSVPQKISGKRRRHL